MPGKILVGIDGSADARRAVEWAAAVAVALGAEVVAVHALGLLLHTRGAGVVPSESHREEVRSLLEGEWSEPLRAAGASYRCELLDGNPASALLAAASEEDAELVVVGTRGIGGFPGLQLGSTSMQLVQHCTRPVTVVPAGSAA